MEVVKNMVRNIASELDRMREERLALAARGNRRARREFEAQQRRAKRRNRHGDKQNA